MASYPGYLNEYAYECIETLQLHHSKCEEVARWSQKGNLELPRPFSNHMRT